MVWQRFAKSPRIACAGSSPAASAKVSVVSRATALVAVSAARSPPEESEDL
jgi:hypothetical protein